MVQNKFVIRIQFQTISVKHDFIKGNLGVVLLGSIRLDFLFFRRRDKFQCPQK